jgi:hypothetical protein
MSTSSDNEDSMEMELDPRREEASNSLEKVKLNPLSQSMSERPAARMAQSLIAGPTQKFTALQDKD